MKIITDKQPNGEWTAIDDDTYDGAPDAGQRLMGWGSTEAEAKEDLMRLFQERDEYFADQHESEAQRREEEAEAEHHERMVERARERMQWLFGFQEEEQDI